MMKELEYLVSELDWKNEIISDADVKFMSDVSEFLEQHPDIKEVFDKTMDRRMAEAVSRASAKAEASSSEDYRNQSQETQETKEKKTNPKLKTAYREIVKRTHPDKVDDPRLNQLYIDASNFYGEGDLLSIYSICDQLGLCYEFGDDDLVDLKTRINRVREKIEIIESATTWVWHNADDERFKSDVVVRYVLTQIR